jgi:hypothetical protein
MMGEKRKKVSVSEPGFSEKLAGAEQENGDRKRG